MTVKCLCCLIGRRLPLDLLTFLLNKADILVW